MLHKPRKNPIVVGDLVLIQDAAFESKWGKLFTDRWNGTFRVQEQLPMGAYVLEELNGTVLKRRYDSS